MYQNKTLIAVVVFMLASGVGCKESASVSKDNTARKTTRKVISQTPGDDVKPARNLRESKSPGENQVAPSKNFIASNHETNTAPGTIPAPVEASVSKPFSRSVLETEDQKKETSDTFFQGRKINWGERTKTVEDSVAVDGESPKPVNPAPVNSANEAALTKPTPSQTETVSPKQNEHTEAENNEIKSDNPVIQLPGSTDTKSGDLKTQKSNPFALTDEAFLKSEPDVKPLPPVDIEQINIEQVDVEPIKVEPGKKEQMDESVWEKQPLPDLSTLEHLEIKPLKTEPIHPSTPDFFNGPKTVSDSVPGMKPEEVKRQESKPESSSVEDSTKIETVKTDSTSAQEIMQEVLPDTVNIPSPGPVPDSKLLNPEPTKAEPSTQETPLPEKMEKPGINPQQESEHSSIVIDFDKPVHATIQNQDDPFAIGEAKTAETRKANEQKSSTGNAVQEDAVKNDKMQPPQPVPQQSPEDENTDIFGNFGDETPAPQDVKKQADVPVEDKQPEAAQTLKQDASISETAPETVSKSQQPRQETNETGDSTDVAKPDRLKLKEPLEIPPQTRLTPVEAFLISEARRSPVRLMESVELLYQLNRPELAKPLMRQLIDTEMTPKDYSQLAKRINPATLMHLSSDEAYQPEGAVVVQKIITGAQSYFESRIRIEQAMQQLLNGTDLKKEDAMHSILSGQETAIEFLMERLAISDDPQEVAESQALLYTFGEDARKALQEAVPNPNMKLAMRAAYVLTRFGKKSDAQFMFPMLFDANLTDSDRRQVASMVQLLRGNVPSKADAAAILHATATNYFRERVPFRLNEDNLVRLWMVPDGGSTPKYVAVTEQDASKFYTEKFARFALQIDSQNQTYRRLWIVACFDLVGNKLGSDNPVKIDPSLIDSVKENYSVLEVENALSMAMQYDRPMAARVAAELLGHIGTAETVIYRGGSQSALIRAAGFSDRRVRFAALASIMKLDPQQQYPGSSVVSESLVFFTRATGIKRAIVAAPWIGDAKKIAGLLEQKALGYKPVVATGGREAMQLAIDSADTELMMLDWRTPNPDVGFLIQDMRADNRTHNVPVGVMAVPDEITRAERAAFGNRMSRACSKPMDEEMAKFIVDNLLRETGVEQIPHNIRLAEAKQSILWVAQLYERSTIYRFENIEQIAYNTLWEPELTPETLQLVRLIPTQRAQIMLAQMISATPMPIEIRQQALEAFRFHAQRHGVLIRGRLILDLYDAYNNSAGEPLASQQIRSSLLDSIEQYANYMQNIGKR